jgi:hypothetical protein
MAVPKKASAEERRLRIGQWVPVVLVFLLGILATPAVSKMLESVWPKTKPETISHRQVIEGIQEVGELVALTATVKDIQTMQKPPKWYMTQSKKLALICKFELEYRYDLSQVKLADASTGRITVEMPPCRIKTNLTDTEIYDEQDGIVRVPVPILVPITVEAYRDRISTEDRNRMIEEAQKTMRESAGDADSQATARAEQSAKRTLQSLARVLGVQETVEVVFRDRAENQVEESK